MNRKHKWYKAVESDFVKITNKPIFYLHKPDHPRKLYPDGKVLNWFGYITPRKGNDLHIPFCEGTIVCKPMTDNAVLIRLGYKALYEGA